MQRKKRVLLISKWYPTPHYPSAGIFVKRHALATLPHADITVLHAEPDPSLRGWRIRRSFAEEDGLPTLRYALPKSPTRIPPLDRLLKFLLYYYCMLRGFYFLNKKNGGFDLVHATVLLRVGLLALFIKKIHRIPYIVSEHWTGYLPLTNDYKKSRMRRWLCPPVIRNARLVCPASDDLGRAMRAHGLDNVYATVHNVVDTDFFQPPSIPRKGKIRVLTVAMLLDKHKNISGILRVLAALRGEGVDLEYHIVGKGADGDKLRAYAQQVGLGDSVRFHGWQPAGEVARLMRESDFLMMFSNYENLPCVIVEAFASGLPVLATDVGGIREMVANDRLGALVEAGDEGALLREARKMTRSARQVDKAYIARYAGEHFGHGVIGRRLAGLYAQALADAE